jgi:molecular chaperone DnaK (HSP70)
MDGWALDLGTTNSGIARWDDARGQASLVELPDVCRLPDADDPLVAPRMVPSAVHLVEHPGLTDRIGSLRPFARHAFIGRTAFIGRQAIERNQATLHPAFVPAFKSALGVEPTRAVGHVGRQPITARGAARAFLRELLAEAKKATGQRVRDLVAAAPVSAFETYRAEVQGILGELGVGRVRFVDEPLAVALGYGLGISQDALVLVVDIGGGTMHTEVVRLSARGAAAGRGDVLAKRGLPIGGCAVDSWVLCDLAAKMGHPIDEWADDEGTRFWRRLMLAEACRVKEAVYFAEKAPFLMLPPGSLGDGAGRAPGAETVDLTRADLVSILDARGFYRDLDGCFDTMFADGAVKADDLDHVLAVGGSTLLPGVFPLLERRFGRGRVRAWQPFEAVAYGAACFAANRIATADFIVHDYAVVTHDAATGAAQHTVVIPQGTRFPTPPDFWRRQFVPTCAMGEPETVFKLVVCEVAKSDGGGRKFVWDAAGDLQKVGVDSGPSEVVVPLNESSPTLGYLDPPHAPTDRRPRLDVSFGVNGDRWLIATVQDLLTHRELMRQEPVVRLL